MNYIIKYLILIILILLIFNGLKKYIEKKNIFIITSIIVIIYFIFNKYFNINEGFKQKNNKSVIDSLFKGRKPNMSSVKDGLNGSTFNEYIYNSTLKRKSSKNKSLQDKSLQDKPLQDKPLQDKSLQDTPLQDKSLQDTPLQDKPLQDKPINVETLQDIPYNSPSSVIKNSPLNTPIDVNYYKLNDYNLNLYELTNKNEINKTDSCNILTDSEIRYYINLFNINISNENITQIKNDLIQIKKLDATRGNYLFKLLDLMYINKQLTLTIANTQPQKLITIIDMIDKSDIFKTVYQVNTVYNNDTDIIQILERKIYKLEEMIEKSKNCYINYNYEDNDNDLKYNTLNPEKMKPLGSYDYTFNNKWDNTYTLLNTDKWRQPLSIPPVCKQEKSCTICPTLTSGYPVNVLDYDKSRYVMGPDNISINYINKLNSKITP
jgi:hypothetical protein